MKIEDILRTYELRRKPIWGSLDYGLPAADADFSLAKSCRVEGGSGYRFQSFDPTPSESNFKLDRLSREFHGQFEILLLHAYLVSHTRKCERPANVDHLFRRLWREEHDFLLQHLSPRWILSAVISFGVCGENEKQRSAGLAFNFFFSMMKLYEFERLFSGSRPWQPFELERKVTGTLPVGLTPFSLKGGDLRENTLAALYYLGTADELIRGPCECLIRLLLSDRGSIFARLSAMKAAASPDTPPP